MRRTPSTGVTVAGVMVTPGAERDFFFFKGLAGNTDDGLSSTELVQLQHYDCRNSRCSCSYNIQKQL